MLDRSPGLSSDHVMSRVLVVSHDHVRRAMAGPAIRNFELARVLHKAGHEVTLAAPISTDIDEQAFAVATWMSGPDGGLRELMRDKDVILIQGFVLEHNMYLLDSGARLVIDLYDPFHLEYVASFTHDPEANRVPDWPTVLRAITDQMRLGDFFLCASERQRDLWIGALSSLNRINPETYVADPSLHGLIDVVPFGIPAEAPRKQAWAIRGVVPGIGHQDFLLLWAGGIYNWFDPLTLILAVAHVSQQHPELKLLFLATAHPNPGVPEMAMVTQARRLAEETGMLDRHVFFNETWVPYERRADWLLEANAGVSTHQDHLETRFSFRTRILDYFWADLPVICTAGDSLAELVERERLGVTVPPSDVEAVALALTRMIESPEERQDQAARVREQARHLTWEVAAAPLVRYCHDPRGAPDRVGLARRTDAVPIPLRSNHARALLAGHIPAVTPPHQNLVLRAARVWQDEGPIGVARRVKRRLRG
jgi:glycosyltransferase involved in cell wall biosynthesis